MVDRTADGNKEVISGLNRFMSKNNSDRKTIFRNLLGNEPNKYVSKHDRNEVVEIIGDDWQNDSAFVILSAS